VVVIGAGAVGAVTALQLAERGLRVTLLDRGDPCRGTSGATFSWAAAHSKEPLFYHRFSRAAVERHPALAERLGVDLEWRPCFSLYAELDEEPCRERRERVQQKAAEGYGLSWLSGAQARALAPQLNEQVLGASLCEGEGTLNAFRLVLGAVHAARRRGAELRFNEELLGVERDAQGVRALRTTQGSISCRRVVVAAGAQGASVAAMVGIKLPLQQVKGELLVTEPWPERLPGVVADVQQTPSGNLLLGVTWEPERDDTLSTVANMRATARRACRALPFLRKARVIRSFAGVRPVPHDMLPYLGGTAHCPGLYFALAHSGITLAPLIAELIDARLHGQQHPCWDERLAPDRAMELA